MKHSKPVRAYQTDVARRVALTTHRDEYDVKEVVDATVAVLTEMLAEGYTLSLAGFGTFATSWRPARRTRHIRTGRVTTLPSRRQATFRAGPRLRQALRDNDGSFAA